ncbi:MAG: hypothetical protein ACUVQM_05285 [Candidatus Hadarchaeaceae archaeon]
MVLKKLYIACPSYREASAEARLEISDSFTALLDILVIVLDG